MPYPNPSVVPDGPSDLLALAQAVDDAMSDERVRVDSYLDCAVWSGSFSALASSGNFNNTNLATVVKESPNWSRPSSAVYECESAGVYRITLCFTYQANATNNRGAGLVGSGSLGSRFVIIPALSAGFTQTVVLIWERAFSAGDTVTVQRFQASGSALDVEGTVSFERIG